MKKVLSVLIIMVLCFCLCACSSKKEEDDTVKVLSAFSTFPDTMPEFSTVDLDDHIVTNDVFSQAEITVVNFWDTFCGPCVNEMPELTEWEASMPEDVQLIGIVVDAVSKDSDEYDAALQITEKTGVAYRNLIPTAEMNDIINGITGVPTTFFVDRDGKLIGDPIVGANVDGYRKVVEDYLNGQK